MGAKLTIRMLGAFEVETGQEILTHFRTQKTASLLAYLAANPGSPHSRDELAALLWPGSDLESARTSLRTALTALRGLLHAGDSAVGSIVIADRQTVGLNPVAVITDVGRFEHLAKAAATVQDPRLRAQAAAEAAAAYGGPFLPGFQDEWVVRRRFELQAEYEGLLRAIEDSAEPAPTEAGSVPDCRVTDIPAGPERRWTPLPAHLTRFFGRVEEIESVLGALDTGSARLITLTGPGGSGKTRLSIEAARRWSTVSGLPVLFVPLADITDSTFLADAILHALQIDRVPHSTAVEQVVHGLCDRRCLMALDNFEQLVEAGTDTLLQLLQSAPHVTCIVTSRQRLDVGGELEIPVRPLPVPSRSAPVEALQRFASVQLFVDRANAARLGFALSPANAASVGAICERLEGIPLAIELAAAWSSALTPAQLLDRLDRSFSLLESRRKDLAPRHRTLRAAIDWSYQLLPPELQRFFARLSVFRGGWTLEAAEIVCAETDSLDYLRHLQDRSLILAEEAGSVMRYRFLETLREFAADQLSQQEADALRDRHARWCLRIAETARAHIVGEQQAAWLRRLEGEHDNFRAALDRSLTANPELALRLTTALDRFWEVRGFVSEGSEWLDRALAAASPSSPMRPLAVDLAGRFAWFSNRFEQAAEWFRQSLELNRALGAEATAGPLANLARMKAFVEGDTAGARPLLQEALEIATRSGDILQLQNILEMLCQVSLFEGDIPAAILRSEEWLSTAQHSGDASSIAGALVMCGIARMNASQFDRAKGHFQETLDRSAELGERYWAAGALWGLGVIAFCTGDMEEAARRYGGSLEKLRDTGFEIVKHFVLEVVAILAAATGDGYRGATLLGAVRQLQQDSRAPVARILHLDFGPIVERAREQMGAAAFEAAYESGRKMSMAEAVDYAYRGLAAGPAGG